jgi:ABC-2 type transport system permease protein
VITACFNNIASAVTFQREDGVLKRAHGTPLPSAAFLGARVVHAVLVAVLLVVITAAFGRAVYQAEIPTGLSLLRFIVALLVGAAAFCALGLAATAVIPNADAAAPVVNAIILPIEFLSGIFIPFGNRTPAWVLWIAKIFPVRHFVLSMEASFLGTAFSWTDVLIVAAWGVAGMLLAVRFFTWEPRQG